MADSPERVARGVYRVDAVGLANVINVLLIEDEDGWTLVDTGVGSSAGRIKNALVALGSGPEGLKRIFLTHQHDDHIGGLKGVLEWASGAEVSATEHEAAVVSGQRELRCRQSNPDSASSFSQREAAGSTGRQGSKRRGSRIRVSRDLYSRPHHGSRLALAGRGWPAVYGGRFRVPAAQAPGWGP